ncbi:hypothetical protein JCM8097_002272 [Rhodosporidiobolus ruineniae]
MSESPPAPSSPSADSAALSPSSSPSSPRASTSDLESKHTELEEGTATLTPPHPPAPSSPSTASPPLAPASIPSSSSSSASSSSTPAPAPLSSSSTLPPIYARHAERDPAVNYSNAPELTHYLQASFVPSVVPQPDEYQAKEQARVYLEKLAEQVSPGARLLPFGSMANGFALKNSDMDLCCFLAKDAPVRSPSELVELLGGLIEQETNFYVKMLPRARIPIIKLTMPPTPAVPAGMACDIGFENRLALENTRLLLTYAMVDSRLRTLVLFLKVWTKRRKINNPYRGTLSSYGYVLLVIHFLEHVKQPPVLPNLQRLPLPNSSSLDELTYEGHDISFFDDVDALPSVFQTQNADPAGELLIDFFRYFSKGFEYNHSVVSIRSEGGTLPKVQKGWHTDFEFDPEVIVRDQHKLCIEDPFQLNYNVARTVTRDGLYTIRGEFMRAFRILTTPARGPDGIGTLLNSLCEEREDYLLVHPADQPYAHHHPPHHHPPPHPHVHHPPLQHGPYHPSNPYAPQNQQSSAGSSSATASTSSSSTGQQTLQPQQQPKSPRRRSAPSPRMGQAGYGGGGGAPNRADQPLWTAASTNGHAVVLSAPPGEAGERRRAGGRPSAASSEASLAEREGEGRREGGGGGGGAGGDEGEADAEGGASDALATPTAGSSAHAPALHPPPATGHQATPRRPPSFAGSDVSALGLGEGRVRRPSWGASSAGGGGAGGGAYDLHRFFQNPPSSSVSDVGGPTAASSSSTLPAVAPASSSSRLADPSRSVSLTAPSSPDLAASSAYFAGHPPAYGYSGRPAYRFASGGYGSSSSSSSTSSALPGPPHVGPRLAASVPRNPHTAHHAYTNPYASAPVPAPAAYPLSSSASSSSVASSASYGTAATHLGYSSSLSAGANGGAPPPAPIFPAEDREAIALANSITFGNFPELLPLPSYAHYHASGGSAAYVAGAGGWGTTPYGISGPMRVGNRTHGASGGLGRLRMGEGLGLGRRSVAGGEEGDDLDFDPAGSSSSSSSGRPGFFLTGRGRRLASALEEAGSGSDSGRPSRTRGRSVPHVRMGPDGRETLLFGAIEVTLPKAEDVEEAEREEEERDEEEAEREAEQENDVVAEEQREDDVPVSAVPVDEEVSSHPPSPTTALPPAPAADESSSAAAVVDSAEEAEQEVAFLGPTPPLDTSTSSNSSNLYETSSLSGASNGESGGAAGAVDPSTTTTTTTTPYEDAPEQSPSVPVLTTQPPTPAKTPIARPLIVTMGAGQAAGDANAREAFTTAPSSPRSQCDATSPLAPASPLTVIEVVDGCADLDRTPRPSSPTCAVPPLSYASP